jgi:hypothetical protein
MALRCRKATDYRFAIERFGFGGTSLRGVHSNGGGTTYLVAGMVKTLRTFLIALAVASPVLSGLPWTAADASASVIVREAGSQPLEGSREDDAGTVVEQAEEGDSEEEESRGLHLGGAVAVAQVPVTPGGFVLVPSGRRSLASLANQHLSRGPPSRR